MTKRMTAQTRARTMRVAVVAERLSGVTVHDLFVALGIEDAVHSGGTLCVTALLGPDRLMLDSATVYEAGRPAGQLSPEMTQRIVSGMWRAGADFQIVRTYLGLTAGAATQAQTQAALQAFMRVILRLVA